MDFIFSDYGSVVMILPVSKRALSFTRENIHTESWQWFGGRFAVEPRFADILASELPEIGFEVQL